MITCIVNLNVYSGHRSFLKVFHASYISSPVGYSDSLSGSNSTGTLVNAGLVFALHDTFTTWPCGMTVSLYSPLQKHEGTGMSFLYIDYIENLNISTEMLKNEKLLNQV